MLDNVALTKFIFDMLETGRSKNSPSELLLPFSENAKAVFGIDEISIKLAIQKKDAMSASEEYALNAGKPYVDNRLSSYSAFSDLIEYYNKSFKSCAVLPIIIENRHVGAVTFLSKNEDRFSQELLNAIIISTNLLGYQILNKVEREKSVNLAKYFDAAFESIVPQFLVDRLGRIVKANKSALNFIDASAKDITEKNICNIFGFDQNGLEALAVAVKPAVVNLPNSDRIFRISASKINDNLMHVLFYEITENVRYEEIARSLRNAKTDVVLMLDSNTKILWASDNTQDVLKVSKSYIVGRKLSELANQDIAGLIGADSQKSVTLTLNFGNDVSKEVNAALSKNQIGGFSCVLSDTALERLVQSMHREFYDLLDVTSDITITTDELGYITGMNRSVTNVLGYTSDELTHKPLSNIYIPDDSERLFRAMAIAKKEGRVDNIFSKIIAKSQELVPCEQSIRLLNDERGNLAGYIFIIRELKTKRMLYDLQSALKDANREIESWKSESDLKTQFIYNISHDLKTPLTNIKGFTKLMASGEFGNLTDEQKNYMNIIQSEAERLEELIKQILDIAKLSSNKIKLDLQPVDLKKLMNNPSIEALQEVANNKGLTFTVNVIGDIPEVVADPNRILQVLINLIGNAIKFTETGGITVTMFRKGASVRVEVKDTGIGISKEEQKKLFRKFYQVQRRTLTKQEGSGTGLGLSIVKEIMRLHGGKQGVISELGKGSTFWFSIPIHGKKKKQN